MSEPGWIQRQRAEASYTSPSGKRFEFLYEDVEKSFDKHTSEFRFPDVGGSFIQDLGFSGDHIPLVVIFNGTDYDLVAKEFMLALKERGSGILRHPIYGTVRVVPFGTIRRQDRLKTRAGEATVEVAFHQTTSLLFPQRVENFPEVQGGIVEEGRNAASGAVGAAAAASTKVVETETIFDAIQNFTAQTRRVMTDISQQTASVQRRVDSIFESITTQIATFTGDPATLMIQMLTMLEAPVRSSELLINQLAGYRGLFDIFTRDLFTPSSDRRSVNAFRVADGAAAGAIFGASLIAVRIDYSSRLEALSVAVAIQKMCADYVTWRDDNFAALDLDDTGELYAPVNEDCAQTAGFLVELSFALPSEHVVVLERDHTPLDLTFKFYGTTDEDLRLFIDTNQLGGDFLFLLPRGKRVVYFQ